MTHFSACIGCAVPTRECQTLETLKQAIKGLKVTTVRHRCLVRSPIFVPGCAVWVNTMAARSSQDEEPPPMYWFPACFIEQKASKGIAFIKPGSIGEEEDEDWPFQTDGVGFVKVPLSRMRLRILAPAISVQSCPACGQIPTLVPCGQTLSFPRCLAADLAGSKLTG